MGSPYIHMGPIPEEEEMVLVEIECPMAGCPLFGEVEIFTLIEAHDGVIYDLQNGIIHNLTEEECN